MRKTRLLDNAVAVVVSWYMEEVGWVCGVLFGSLVDWSTSKE